MMGAKLTRLPRGNRSNMATSQGINLFIVSTTNYDLFHIFRFPLKNI